MDGGAAAGSVELARDGIVTRGVLLDAARAQGRDWLDDGEEIFPEDLEAAERRQGVRVERGDALLVRTGYRKRNPLGPATDRPGLQATCLPWLREREVAMLGTDVTQDVHPHGYRVGSPIHLVGIWAIGLWLSTTATWNAWVQRAPTAAAGTSCCSRSARAYRGTGSPVNPLAVLCQAPRHTARGGRWPALRPPGGGRPCRTDRSTGSAAHRSLSLRIR